MRDFGLRGRAARVVRWNGASGSSGKRQDVGKEGQRRLKGKEKSEAKELIEINDEEPWSRMLGDRDWQSSKRHDIWSQLASTFYFISRFLSAQSKWLNLERDFPWHAPFSFISRDELHDQSLEKIFKGLISQKWEWSIRNEIFPEANRHFPIPRDPLISPGDFFFN